MALFHISGETQRQSSEFGRNLLCFHHLSFQESAGQRDKADHCDLQRVGREADGECSSDQRGDSGGRFCSWRKLRSHNLSSINSSPQGSIRSTVGQGRLVMSERFTQVTGCGHSLSRVLVRSKMYFTCLMFVFAVYWSG